MIGVIDKMTDNYPHWVAGISVSGIVILLPIFVIGRITLWSTILRSQLGVLDVILVQFLLGIYLLIALVTFSAVKNKVGCRQSSKGRKSFTEYQESYAIDNGTQDTRNQFSANKEYNQVCEGSAKPSHRASITGAKIDGQSQVTSGEERQSIRGRTYWFI